MTSNAALMVIDAEDVAAVGRLWFETRDPARRTSCRLRSSQWTAASPSPTASRTA
jgi:hypothetical protein